MARSIATISDKASQSRLACKRIIQYICQSNLANGDCLPPQEQLRREMGFGHNTLSCAMNLLVDCGMIQRKALVGTVVVDKDALVPDLWTVGLPIFSIGKQNDLFIDTLLRCLQDELTQAGCRWKTYLRQGVPEDDKARIGDFSGLAQDIEHRAIDGLLSPALIQEESITKLHSGFPVCYVVAQDNFDCGVGINRVSMIENAVTTLLAEGCKHLALISGPSLLGEGQQQVRESFENEINRAISSCEQAELLTPHSAAVTRQSGHIIAHTLLSRAPDQRPDGVILLSDVLAIGFSEVCTHSHYHPRMIVQTNKQAPVLFGIPTTCFEVDVPQMAQRGVRMILNRLHNPLLENKKNWVTPQRVQENFDWKEKSFSISQTPVAVRACA